MSMAMQLDKHNGRDWLENSAGSNSRQYPANAALDGAIIYDKNKGAKPYHGPGPIPGVAGQRAFDAAIVLQFHQVGA